VKLPFITVYDTLGFGPDSDVAVAVSNADAMRRSVAERDCLPFRLVVADTLARTSPGMPTQPRDVGFPPNLPAFVKALRKGRSLTSNPSPRSPGTRPADEGVFARGRPRPRDGARGTPDAAEAVVQEDAQRL